uniref:Uncharacterized protein n=2 Tax=gambiae species complex TaxID=44542 RepID=A0A0E4G8N6_ANOGA
MGYRRRHRSRSRDDSPERSSGSRSTEALQQQNVTAGEGDHETSGNRTSSSRHHHRSSRHHQHSDRPRRRRERPEWLKMILRAQRQFVWAILMTVGLCLKRGAQLVSDMLLGAPVAAPVEGRPQPGPSGMDRSGYAAGGASSSTAVATRGSSTLVRSASFDDPATVPNRRAIVPPEDLD